MLVWTTAGYVVAGGERGENTGRVFVTTVRDGKTAPATGVSIRVSSPERDGRHDWISSLAWDGCQFAFVHTNGLNPSGIQLVSFR